MFKRLSAMFGLMVFSLMVGFTAFAGDATTTEAAVGTAAQEALSRMYSIVTSNIIYVFAFIGVVLGLRLILKWIRGAGK